MSFTTLTYDIPCAAFPGLTLSIENRSAEAIPDYNTFSSVPWTVSLSYDGGELLAYYPHWANHQNPSFYDLFRAVEIRCMADSNLQDAMLALFRYRESAN